MIYIFKRYLDIVGEGERAELQAYAERTDADKAWAHDIANDIDREDIIEMKMIVGSQVNSYQLSAPPERELTDDDLRVSSLEDVDNLEDKEKT